MMTDPDGNLYRGWAIGLHSGARLKLMTYVVILVQIIVPAAVLIHQIPYLGNSGGFAYIWKATMTLDDWVKKIGGILLLALVFLNGESIMRRTDLQTDKLRDLYSKRLSKGWMFIDAFCNSWCISLCAFCTPCLLWTSDDPKELVLDAFGVLFLHNLDEYSGDLEYGVEVSDFDDLIEARIDEKAKRLLEDCELTERRAEVWHEHWKEGCFAHGDIFYSIGRLVNLVLMHTLMPAFAVLKWEQSETNGRNVDNRQFFSPFSFIGLFALLSMLLRFVLRMLEFQRAVNLFELQELDDDHPEEEVQMAKRDFTSFASIVFFGRHDPRAPPQIAAFKD
jgi:hypothetical protein